MAAQNDNYPRRLLSRRARFRPIQHSQQFFPILTRFPFAQRADCFQRRDGLGLLARDFNQRVVRDDDVRLDAARLSARFAPFAQARVAFA